MTARIISWDWKEQPDIGAIMSAVKEISEGRMIVRELDTGGDCYALVVADYDISDSEAMELYCS